MSGPRSDVSVQKKDDAAQALARIAALAFYMASSAGMIIFNKLVLREVHLPIALCIIQMAFTVLMLGAVPALRRTIHFGSRRDTWRWARVIPPLFAIMLASSMMALKHASMGAVVVVRNVAPLPTLLIEALSGERVQVDLQSVLALLAALGGVVLYSRHDLQFSPLGLAWMLLNMVSAVVERLLQRRMIAVEPIDVSKTGMMLLNNAGGGVLLCFLLPPFGEAAQLGRFAELDGRGAVLLLLSCGGGIAISYAGIAAQKYVTATGFMVLSNSCKFGVVAFGIVVFGEARSPFAVVGCATAIGAGLWYARARSELAAAAADLADTHAARPSRGAWRYVQVAAVAALLVSSALPTAPAPAPAAAVAAAVVAAVVAAAVAAAADTDAARRCMARARGGVLPLPSIDGSEELGALAKA